MKYILGWSPHPLPVDESSVGVDRQQVKHPQDVEAIDAIAQDLGKQRVPVPCLRDLGTWRAAVEEKGAVQPCSFHRSLLVVPFCPTRQQNSAMSRSRSKSAPRGVRATRAGSRRYDGNVYRFGRRTPVDEGIVKRGPSSSGKRARRTSASGAKIPVVSNQLTYLIAYKAQVGGRGLSRARLPGSAGFQPAIGRRPPKAHAGKMPALPGGPRSREACGPG